MKRRYPQNFWRLFSLMAVVVVGGAIVLRLVGIDPVFALLAGVCVFTVPAYTQEFTIESGEPTNLISELLSKPVALGEAPEDWLRTRTSRKPFARAIRRLHGVLLVLLALLALTFVIRPTEDAGPVLYGITFVGVILLNVLAIRIRSRFDRIEVVDVRRSHQL